MSEETIESIRADRDRLAKELRARMKHLESLRAKNNRERRKMERRCGTDNEDMYDYSRYISAIAVGHMFRELLAPIRAREKAEGDAKITKKGAV
jgi:hypothetical protein